jgi:hypothetical protein
MFYRLAKKWQCKEQRQHLLGRVAEPKLFFSAPAPDFQIVSAPAPAPAPTWALRVPVFTAFKWKSRLFMTFWKEYRLNSIFWSYSIWIMIKYTTLVCPGAGAESRSRNFSIPAPAKSFGSGSATLLLPFNPRISLITTTLKRLLPVWEKTC